MFAFISCKDISQVLLCERFASLLLNFFEKFLPIFVTRPGYQFAVLLLLTVAQFSVPYVRFERGLGRLVVAVLSLKKPYHVALPLFYEHDSDFCFAAAGIVFLGDSLTFCRNRSGISVMHASEGAVFVWEPAGWIFIRVLVS